MRALARAWIKPCLKQRARTFSLSQRNSACRAPRGNLRAKSQNFAPNRTQHNFFKSNRKILCESDQAGFWGVSLNTWGPRRGIPPDHFRRILCEFGPKAVDRHPPRGAHGFWSSTGTRVLRVLEVRSKCTLILTWTSCYHKKTKTLWKYIKAAQSEGIYL